MTLTLFSLQSGAEKVALQVGQILSCHLLGSFGMIELYHGMSFSASLASEMIGADQAGWDEVVGIEMGAENCEIGEARLAHWLKEPDQGQLC